MGNISLSLRSSNDRRLPLFALRGVALEVYFQHAGGEGSYGLSHNGAASVVPAGGR